MFLNFFLDPVEAKLLLLLSDECLLSAEMPLDERRLSASDINLLALPRTLIRFLLALPVCFGEKFFSSSSGLSV